MDHIARHLRSQQAAMLDMLRRFVECESPSAEKNNVDRFGRLVAAELRSIGMEVIQHESLTGNHLQARFRQRVPSPSPTLGILLLGHLDTVWPVKTIEKMPFRVVGRRACGPGVYDMKAGIVIGIFALRCLRDFAPHAPRNVTFLLNADEEVGSPSSRALTEKLARQASAALVLEPSYGPRGALKTSRKGVGEFRVRVIGKAAHAGLDPTKGASAILELSRQLLNIQSLTDDSAGITLNAGIVRGGTRSNVVAAEAEAVIDVRIRKRSDAARIERELRRLKPTDKRTKIEITGAMNRPPFECSPSGAKLFNVARDVARFLRIPLAQAAVGGGSDGNFTAALGTPTLDGLGAVGDGAHAAHEHVIIDELPRRAALLTHLILKLTG